eukprot:1739673-Pleurochrysis_carterae.AAC.1
MITAVSKLTTRTHTTLLRHRRSPVASHGCPRRARRPHAARCALRALVHRLVVVGESALGVHVYQLFLWRKARHRWATIRPRNPPYSTLHAQRRPLRMAGYDATAHARKWLH